VKAIDKGVKINMATHHFDIPTLFLKDHLNRKIESQRHGKVGMLFAEKRKKMFIRC
jgi:hypothetical protein